MVFRDRNQNKSSEEVDEKLSQIQDQLQKLMEGMSSMYERNIQADKELLGIKKILGFMALKEKEKEHGRAESSTNRSCPVGIHTEGRNKDSMEEDMGRLKPKLNKAVKIQASRTLMQAYKVARLHEGVF
ncbi:hypothetical protein KY284_027003 [Solanum tuberosum]|nr:hypothetical protein KY284_027003 [Solanum tuberosum]